MNRLKGKTAFITGSGAGIGREAAILFAREGANVIVAEQSEEAGRATAELVRAEGGHATFIQTDVSDEQSVALAIARTIETYGALNILYNNAGGSAASDGLVTEMTIEAFWRPIKVDLFGTFLCCRFAIPELIRAGGGTIVNTTSTTALRGVPGVEAYSAAKGGVISLTQAMAIDFAEHGIRVNAIAAGGIRTERTAKRIAASPHAAATQGAHLLGIGHPRDVADAAIFLACDESRYITGTVLTVDGGWCAASPGVQAKQKPAAAEQAHA